MESDAAGRTSPTLLRRLRRSPSDPAAWDGSVRGYGPQIYAWCRRWNLQDADAQDVTQTVLLKLAERLRAFTYDPEGSFRSWLKTVTHNAWKRFVSDRGRPG